MTPALSSLRRKLYIIREQRIIAKRFKSRSLASLVGVESSNIYIARVFGRKSAVNRVNLSCRIDFVRLLNRENIHIHIYIFIYMYIYIYIYIYINEEDNDMYSVIQQSCLN